MIIDATIGSFGDKWRVESPVELVEHLATLVPVEKDTVITVYTNNMKVVAAIAMGCPITGNDEVDNGMWEGYLTTEWATFKLIMASPEAIIPDAVWYVILGYRPSGQTDILRNRPDVVDICMVHDQRMWSLTCSDTDCPYHSPSGSPVNVPGLSTV